MENSTKQPANSILIIIGNGFDLDMGLKTSYSDFIKSPYFSQNTELHKYLKHRLEINNWIDLENELKNYLKCINADINKENHSMLKARKGLIANQFECLRNDLTSYLEHLPTDSIKIQCYAYQLMCIISKIKRFSTSDIIEIINFNYTDISPLSYRFINMLHVHGSLKNNNIILGFEDDVEIDDSFCFMIKSHSPHFRSFNIREKLEKANEIIFFGHSLGMTDYHYFSNFFKTQSGLDDKGISYRKKKIRIFTYDEDARQNILIQLRNMNEKRVNELYDLNDLEIYRTKDCIDDIKIQSYFNHLKKIATDAEENQNIIINNTEIE